MKKIAEGILLLMAIFALSVMVLDKEQGHELVDRFMEDHPKPEKEAPVIDWEAAYEEEIINGNIDTTEIWPTEYIIHSK